MSATNDKECKDRENMETSTVKQLYPFQQEDVGLLQRVSRQVIGYPTGMGKTVVALHTLQADSATLIVAPKHLLDQWEYAISEWTPHIRPYRVTEVKPEHVGGITYNHVGLVNYAMLNKSMHFCGLMGYKTLIFDEAHFLCNRQSQRSKAAANLTRRAERVYCLSATPRDDRQIGRAHV